MKKIIKKLFNAAILIYSFTCVCAQTSRIDSLRNELSNYKSKDKVRLELLISTVYEVYHTDTPWAETLIEEAVFIADSLDFKKGKAEALYFNGQVELVKSNYPKALDCFKQSLKIYESLELKSGISYCLNIIGVLYYNQGKLSNALEYYQKSLAIDEENNDLNGISGSYNNIGNIYADQGNYSEAINYYTKSLKVKEELKDEYGVAMSFSNIGAIYSEQSNYPKALEYFKKALLIYEKSENQLKSSTILSDIGGVYKNNKEIDKALFYFNKGLEISRKQGNKRKIADYLNDIGNIYSDQFEYEKALSFFYKSLKVNKEINSKTGISKGLNNIADVQVSLNEYEKAFLNYRKAISINKEIGYQIGLLKPYLGIATIYYKEKKYKQALEYSYKSRELAIEFNALKPLSNISKLLSEIYLAQKKYKRALESYQEFKMLNDSVFNESNVKKMAQLEYKYKYQQELDFAKQREIKLNSKIETADRNLLDSEREKLWFAIGFLLLLMILGISVFVQRIKNIKSINQNILIEQKLLRSQMTPHFIFNSLSVLQGMVLNKESEKAVNYLSKFSKLLRINLESSRDKIVPLENEIQAIENYLTLQNLSASTLYNYKIEVGKEIDQKRTLIPSMLIQPFVENSVEHAFGKKEQQKEIKIELIYANSQLTCVITDNGKGIEVDNNKRSSQKKSLATQITSERLEMLSKEFKVAAGITIENQKHVGKKGTKVTLLLPYKISKND